MRSSLALLRDFKEKHTHTHIYCKEIEGYLPKAPLPDSPKNLEVVKVHCEEKEKKNLLKVPLMCFNYRLTKSDYCGNANKLQQQGLPIDVHEVWGVVHVSGTVD